MVHSRSDRATPLNPDVAFVVCPSYHGATLLALLLDRHPDVVHLGDTAPSRSTAQHCSCGEVVRDCPFWQGLAGEVDLSRYRDQERWLPRFPPFTGRHRLDWGLALAATVADRFAGRAVDAALNAQAAAYRDAYRRYASYAASRHGASVFVDGQKSPVGALYLMSGRRRPAPTIHLYRDPRGYAWSQISRGRADAVSAAREWRRQHELATVLLRWLSPVPPLKVRYEDVAREPDATMSRIFAFLGVEANGQRGAHHQSHVIGNRMVKTFDGTVRLDEAWRTGLSAADAATILRLSGPLARRMGYT